jgi:small subunit ribosomal protein S8e
MKAGRKISGGRYKRTRKKKLTGRQSQQRKVRLGDEKRKILYGRGTSQKMVNLFSNIVNVTDGKKSKRTKIKNVIETPSDTFLARQNVLVKGAIIETELGKARITNRPSQEGNVQAVLIK